MVLQQRHKLLSLAIASFFSIACQSFVPTITTTSIPHHNILSNKDSNPTQCFLARGGLADPEQDEESKTTKSWTRVSGGYLPNLQQNHNKSPDIQDINSMLDFKRIVVDNNDTKLTVVRFYAPWCRACKANQPLFRKLANSYGSDVVRFVQVPLNPQTAALQQGLGIPTLPFGHIYHADAGLVEERKIGKHSFRVFEKVLQSYIQGYCEVTYDEPLLLP